MEREVVQSTSIRSIGYDASGRILELEFQKYGVFRYFEVSEFMYQGLLLAKSKGAFFNKRISGRYRFEEIK